MAIFITSCVCNLNLHEWNTTGYSNCENDIVTMFSDENGNLIPLDSYEKQLVCQIVDLSHVANTKFSLFSIALTVEMSGLLLLMFFWLFRVLCVYDYAIYVATLMAIDIL